ncbi:21463_t:CDS:1, partial [Racocetra persica]
DYDEFSFEDKVDNNYARFWYLKLNFTQKYSILANIILSLAWIIGSLVIRLIGQFSNNNFKRTEINKTEIETIKQLLYRV